MHINSTLSKYVFNFFYMPNASLWLIGPTNIQPVKTNQQAKDTFSYCTKWFELLFV